MFRVSKGQPPGFKPWVIQRVMARQVEPDVVIRFKAFRLFLSDAQQASSAVLWTTTQTDREGLQVIAARGGATLIVVTAERCRKTMDWEMTGAHADVGLRQTCPSSRFGRPVRMRVAGNPDCAGEVEQYRVGCFCYAPS